MKLTRFKTKCRELRSIMRTEYGHIFRDEGVALVLVLALLIYATVYSVAYDTQVLRNIPIGVVDLSRTHSSRALINIFDAAPNIEVAYTPVSMEQAREMFFDRKIYGIVYIPDDYERTLMRGERSVVGVYVDASYFLMYRQTFSDVVSGVNTVGSEVEFSRLLAGGASLPQAETISDPVSLRTTDLFNPYLGYGTFVMPSIIIIIIQQTMLIGIGMIGGTWREFGLYRKLALPGERRLSTIPIVLGKSLCYLSVYCVTGLYILVVHYKMFHFPMNGSFGAVLGFMIPYALACIMLAVAVSTLFRYRENSILLLLWTSIPMLLLSGASVPREAIPPALYAFGKIFPSSSGVEGFVRIQTAGATLREVAPQVITLWILAGVYFVLACLGVRRVIRIEERNAEKPAGDSPCGCTAVSDAGTGSCTAGSVPA